LVLCCISLVFTSWTAAAEQFDGSTVDYRLAHDASAAALPQEEAALAATSSDESLVSEAASDDAAPFLQVTDDHRVDLTQWIATGGRCGTVEFGPPDLPRAPRKGEPVVIEASIEIPVSFHVIYKEVTTNGTLVRTGNISKTQILSQMKVLNAAYASLGVTFTLRSIDRVLNKPPRRLSRSIRRTSSTSTLPGRPTTSWAGLTSHGPIRRRTECTGSCCSTRRCPEAAPSHTTRVTQRRTRSATTSVSSTRFRVAAQRPATT
jgi:hypothetical protein